MSVTSDAKDTVKAPIDKIWGVVGNWSDISWILKAASVKVDGNERLITYEDGSKVKQVLLEKNDSDHSLKFEIFDSDTPSKIMAHATKISCEMSLVASSGNPQETELLWKTQHHLKSGQDEEAVKAKIGELRKVMLQFFKAVFEK